MTTTADDAGAVTEAAYDATADRYAARWPSSAPVAATLDRLVAFMPDVDGPVVDVGCGAGRDLAWLAGRGLRAIGVDRSAALLAHAAAAAPAAALVRADLRGLPLATGSVAAWWACASLLHLPPDGVAVALAELGRIARADAVGALSVKEGSGSGFEAVDGGSHRRFFCYWSPADLDAVLGAAGWAVIDGWTEPDTRGRHPWLVRLVRRARARPATT